MSKIKPVYTMEPWAKKVIKYVLRKNLTSILTTSLFSFFYGSFVLSLVYNEFSIYGSTVINTGSICEERLSEE